jgi:hypothetical protein
VQAFRVLKFQLDQLQGFCFAGVRVLDFEFDSAGVFQDDLPGEPIGDVDRIIRIAIFKRGFFILG